MHAVVVYVGMVRIVLFFLEESATTTQTTSDSKSDHLDLMMFSTKFRTAVVLLLQVLASASAFIPPSASHGANPRLFAGDTRRYANQKLADQNIKPSDLSKAGLGGFDLISKTNKKFMEGSGASAKGGVVVASKKAPPPTKVGSPSQKKVTAAKGGIKTNKATTVSKDVGKISKSTSNDEATPWFKKLF
jgi:hypothetical protein